ELAARAPPGPARFAQDVLDEAAPLLPESGRLVAVRHRAIRGEPGDERRALVLRIARGADGLQVTLRGGGDTPVDGVVEGARERSDHPPAPDRVELRPRLLRARGVASRRDQLAQEPLTRRFAVARRGACVADVGERRLLRRRTARRATGDGREDENE